MKVFNQQKWIGYTFLLSSLILVLWKKSHLQIDFSQWKALALTEVFWLELMPFMYFLALFFVGISLIWKHKFSLIILFLYVGFTTEELLLGYCTSNAVQFSLFSQIGLFITVLVSAKAIFLLRTDEEAELKKYSFRNLWIGVALGVGSSILFSLFNFW